MPPVVSGVVSARVVKVVMGVRAAYLIDCHSDGDLRQLRGHGCDTTTGASVMVVRNTPSTGASAASTARAIAMYSTTGAAMYTTAAPPEEPS